MCKTEGGQNPNQDCILPFSYYVLDPENETIAKFVTEFQGCVNTRSRGLWCPTKLDLIQGGDGNEYIEGLDEEEGQDWGLCSPGCIKHGYE